MTIPIPSRFSNTALTRAGMHVRSRAPQERLRSACWPDPCYWPTAAGLLHLHPQHALIPHSPAAGQIARGARIQTLRGQPQGHCSARAMLRMGVRDSNTEGPVGPSFHYCISPLERVDLDQILWLIRRRKYCLLHTPRQSGKTSALKALADKLNSTGECRCVYANFGVAQSAREDVHQAMRAVLDQLGKRARRMLGDTFINSVVLRASCEVPAPQCSEPGSLMHKPGRDRSRPIGSRPSTAPMRP